MSAQGATKRRRTSPPGGATAASPERKHSAGPSAPRKSKSQASLLSFLTDRSASSSPVKAGSAEPPWSAKTQEEIDLERALAESVKDHELWVQRFSAAASSSRLAAESGHCSASEDAVRGGKPDAPIEVLSSSPSLSVDARPSPPKSGHKNTAPKLHPISAFAAASSPATKLELAGSSSHDSGAAEPKVEQSAFAVLMRSHSEQKEWANAEEIENNNYKGKARSRPDARTAPFYKVLQGMPLSVDAFRFGKIPGCTGYFLTHFHSDHYGGITANWAHGPIYCSKTTANLVRTCLRVEERWLRPLPMEQTVVIPDSGGVKVTCIEANHCPGSCLFLFEGPQTAEILASNTRRSPHIGSKRQFRYLHCGDFRASPLHANHPLIKGKKLDIIYLDTTYLNPRYCFPAQEQVVDACAEIVRARMPETQHQSASSGPHALMPMDSSAVAMRQWLSSAAKSTEQLCKTETTPSDMDDLTFDGDGQIDGDVEWTEADDEELPDSMAADESPASRPEQDIPVLERDAETDGGQVATAAEADGPVADTGAPPTSTVMQMFHRAARSADEKRRNGRLLVLVGTYTIGKEKIVKAVAQTLGSKVYCADQRKYRVYAQLEDPELHALLTRDPGASVHVTNLHAVNGETLRDTLATLRARGHNFTHAIAFRPTGWTYKPPAGMDLTSPSLERLIAWNQARQFSASGLFPTRDSTPECMIYGVPYSEHSSFFELSAFALSLEYDRIIATVNVGSATSRNKMARWFEKWLHERRRRLKAGLPAILPARAAMYW